VPHGRRITEGHESAGWLAVFVHAINRIVFKSHNAQASGLQRVLFLTEPVSKIDPRAYRVVTSEDSPEMARNILAAFLGCVPKYFLARHGLRHFNRKERKERREIARRFLCVLCSAISEYVVLLRAFFQIDLETRIFDTEVTEATQRPRSRTILCELRSNLCALRVSCLSLRLRLRRSGFFAVKFRVDLLSGNLTSLQ
jgi:hypothetical protein